MKAITFYTKELSEIAEYQKMVFDHFGIEIEQVLCEMPTDADHGRAIDNWLKNNVWQQVAIFDVDCIPLHKHALDHAQNMISNQCDVFAAAQKANHLPNAQVYASPAFCCFNINTWVKSGMPSFIPTQWHDTGGFFHSEVTRAGFTTNLLWPIDVENPVWDLEDGKKFGHGTNYQNTVYHAFEGRKQHDSTSRFIDKCKEILNGSKINGSHSTHAVVS